MNVVSGSRRWYSPHTLWKMCRGWMGCVTAVFRATAPLTGTKHKPTSRPNSEQLPAALRWSVGLRRSPEIRKAPRESFGWPLDARSLAASLRRVAASRCSSVLIAFLMCCGATTRISAQPSVTISVPEEIPLKQVLDRMAQNDARSTLELQYYTSTRTYHLQNMRFEKTADLSIKLTYRYPGLKEYEVLSESGPGAVRERVLRRMVDSEVETSRDEMRRMNQLTSENYNFRLVRRDQAEGRSAYVLEASPRTKSKFLIRGEVWVDAEDFAVLRITGQPAKNPSFWIRGSRFVYRYAKFGSFWLPVSTDADADALVFGRTEVKIRYLDYRINSELGAATVGR